MEDLSTTSDRGSNGSEGRKEVQLGKLEIVFRLGLAHPLLLPGGIPDIPVSITFPETGNKVLIEPPRPGPWPEGATGYGAFDNLVLHVERECEEKEAEHITYADIERIGINRDAAEAFWRLLETIRDIEFVRHNFVAGYPVVHAEQLQSNPLVRKSEANLSYEGKQISTLPLGGVASIGIFPDSWEEAVKKLAQDEGVPSYRSYAVDAIYFATSGDPVRAVIMACAAWETALRTYLSTVAAKKSPAYKVAAT